jgi:ferric-dicitrate binding protein FerR (iron transport regulator)
MTSQITASHWVVACDTSQRQPRPRLALENTTQRNPQHQANTIQVVVFYRDIISYQPPYVVQKARSGKERLEIPQMAWYAGEFRIDSVLRRALDLC